MCEEEKCEHAWETKRSREWADDAHLKSRMTAEGSGNTTVWVPLNLLQLLTLVNHYATETEGKAKTADITRFVCVFVCSQMSRPDSVFFMFMLLIISAGRNPPTLPEISSFPRNSKKSVTLSSTATLQHRGRESVKGLDTNSAFKKNPNKRFTE